MSESRAGGLYAAMQRARRAEKEQTLFYRALAVQAEQAGDGGTAERLNGLLADEQHHFSRLSARLLELGQSVADLPGSAAPPVGLSDWESRARVRERAEIGQYLEILTLEPDPRTQVMIREFLDVERRHEQTLGGKWMGA